MNAVVPDEPPSGESRLVREWGGLRRVARLTHKELRETLRDRRTVGTLLLMPLLVYPLLAIAFQRLIVAQVQPGQGWQAAVGVDSGATGHLLNQLLREGEAVRREGRAGAAEPLRGSALSPTPGEAPFDTVQLDDIRWYVMQELEAGVRDMHLDAGLRLANPQTLAESPRQTPLQFELLYRPESESSRRVAYFLERWLLDINVENLRLRLQQHGDPGSLSLQMAYRRVAGEGGGMVSLATVIPLVLILMTITGAVYPAIDLTAGERERGTLEALMAAPVPRLGLLFAKYLTVLVVALLTALANLVSMIGTALGTGLHRLLFGPEGLTAVMLAEMFLLMVLFTAFFAAVLLAVTSFARSFKEAQAYLIPLMLVALAPGLLSLTPGLHLSGVLAVLPLVNIVLLARDILQGSASLVTGVVAVVSTLLYALAALTLAARVFGADAILYGSQSSWGELWRRPRARVARASVATVAFCAALLFPLFFVAGGQLAQQQQASIATRTVASGALTLLLFGGVPSLLAAWQRVRFTTGFQVRSAPWSSWLAAVVLGFGSWPLAHELFLLGRTLGLATLTQEHFDRVETLLQQWRSLSPLLILACSALAPALAEEWFFRGFLLGALRHRVLPAVAIGGSALLFGLFHTVLGSHLASERLLPSTFLGLLLGWLCWRSRSVLPGILLHGLHNGLLLLVAYYRESVSAWGMGQGEQEHLPGGWIAGGVAATLLGIWLAAAGRPRPD